MIVPGRHLGSEICQALGLDGQKIRRLELVADCDNATTLRVDSFVVDEQRARLIPLLREFELVERHKGGTERYAESYGYDPYNHLGSNAGRKE